MGKRIKIKKRKQTEGEEKLKVVSNEIGEPDWGIYEKYFNEVLEGRSIKSVVKSLRTQGYSVSETTVRARFKEFLAYRKAKDEFEIRLNQVKGEIFSKIRGIQEEINEIINTKDLETKETLGEIGNLIEKRLYEIQYKVNRRLDEIHEDINKKIRDIETEQERQYKKMQYETEMLRKALIQVLKGIADKSLTESLKDAISKKLTNDVIDYLSS